MATKKWTIPISFSNNTAENFRSFFLLAHTTLVEQAWVHVTDVGGQLDFDSISVALNAGQVAGFRIYRLNDPHDHITPIYVRANFGCSFSLLFAVGMPVPSISLEFSDNLLFIESRTFICANPTRFSLQPTGGIVAGPVTQYGEAFRCYFPELGFYGLSMTKTFRNGLVSGSRPAPFLSFIVQRNLDHDMNVIPGFTVYGGAWASSNTITVTNDENARWHCRYIGPDFAHATNNRSFSYRQFDMTQTALSGGQLQVAPVYTQTPEIKQVPSLLTYVNTQIAEGTQFQVETDFGTFNYIALGPYSNLIQDVYATGSTYNTYFAHASVAMLWQ